MNKQKYRDVMSLILQSDTDEAARILNIIEWAPYFDDFENPKYGEIISQTEKMFGHNRLEMIKIMNEQYLLKNLTDELADELTKENNATINNIVHILTVFPTNNINIEKWHDILLKISRLLDISVCDLLQKIANDT